MKNTKKHRFIIIATSFLSVIALMSFIEAPSIPPAFGYGGAPLGGGGGGGGGGSSSSSSSGGQVLGAVFVEEEILEIVGEEGIKITIKEDTQITTAAGEPVETIPPPIVINSGIKDLSTSLSDTEIVTAIEIPSTEEIAFSKKVKLSVPVDSCPTNGADVLHLKNNGTEEWLRATCFNNIVSFWTESISKFVVVKDTTLGISPFTDLEDHWSFEYVEDLRIQGIVDGKTETYFDVNGNLTRAELTKIAVVAFGITIEENASTEFPDISGGWYTDYVIAAEKAGVVMGYPDNTFRPNQSITRSEALKVMLEAAAKNITVNTKVNFPDVDQEAWYAKYINYAYVNDIVSGYDSGPKAGQFGVSDSVTRGEASKILSLLLR